jgi:hypothetical protein
MRIFLDFAGPRARTGRCLFVTVIQRLEQGTGEYSGGLSFAFLCMVKLPLRRQGAVLCCC